MNYMVNYQIEHIQAINKLFMESVRDKDLVNKFNMAILPKISIVIVVYNAGNNIKKCLESVFTQDFKNFEVIVVDNGSEDGTGEFIKKKFPQIKLIENSNNLGFCRANNQGIEISKGEFVFTLNSDVFLESNFLTEFIYIAEESSPEIGMFSPKILKMDKKTIDSTGITLTRTRRFYNRGADEVDLGQHDDKKLILGPCAAAALYKRKMLEGIKIAGEYFDNDFFFLVEDVDLAWRANLSGWKAYFVSEARCYHVGNSSGIDKRIRQYLSFRNRYFMIIKNLRTKDFLQNIIHILSYDLSRIIFVLFTNRLIPRAILEIFYNYPRMLKKRKMILKPTNRCLR